MAQIEVAYDKLDEEKRKGFRSDPKRIEALEAQVKDAIAHLPIVSLKKTSTTAL